MIPGMKKSTLLSWKIGKKALILFMPLFAYFLVMAVILVYVEIDRDRSVVRDEEKHHVENANLVAIIELRTIISDLLVLGSFQELDVFLKNPNPRNRELLGAAFKKFSERKRVYDQVRFLDVSGMEDVRINYKDGNPEIVALSRLQSKALRYYFVDTLKLGKDQIFVSPMDLNIEKGEVERPFKPMIRFGTPIIDEAGRKQGVVLLNYLASNLLDDLDKLHEKDYGDWMLLNQDGYWLKSMRQDKEWGFMFKDRKDVSFSKEFPDAWKRISLETKGQFINDRGLFTFDTINPVGENVLSSSGAGEAYSPSENEVFSRDYYWKIVSYVSSQSLANRTWSRLWRWLLFFVVLILCLVLVSHRLALSQVQRDEADRALRLSEEKHRRLIDGLPEDHFVFSREIDGTLSYISPAAEELLGLKLDEMIGRQWNDVIKLLPGHLELSAESDGLCLENKFPPTLELEYYRPDGSVGIIEIHKHPVCEDGESVAYIEGIARDITERKELEFELRRLATIDPLTGIFNRRRFLEQVSLEQGRSRRYEHGLVFILLDLDYFKRVNDTYGHQAGDEVLKAFASCCQGQLRDTDFMGRVGGEEFGVLLVETSGTEGVEIAERLRREVSELAIEFEGKSISFTVSIGLTTFEKDDLFVKDLFKKADDALYLAKEQGRDRVVRV